MTTKFVGILNVTPDSFSDGGKYTTIESALLHAKKLIEDGASIIDIGAESTRPNAIPINNIEEWQRLESILPAVIRFCHANNVLVSLDTRHAESAKKAIALGIDWINDVCGFDDIAMITAAKDSNCKLVVMHSLGVPSDKNKILSLDVDVIEYLSHWAENKIAQLAAAGILKERLILDPGVGFGKNAKQSWQIINRIDELQKFGVPIFIGHSRKSFLGDGDRDTATIEVSRALVAKGVDYLRVHEPIVPICQ